MRKILIVIDMQNDFIDAALGTKEAVAIVDAVKEKIRFMVTGTLFFIISENMAISLRSASLALQGSSGRRECCLCISNTSRLMMAS